VQRLTLEPPISPDPYSPRDTQDSVVVNLLREHLDTFMSRRKPMVDEACPPSWCAS
jgi:hypothetical protein